MHRRGSAGGGGVGDVSHIAGASQEGAAWVARGQVTATTDGRPPVGPTVAAPRRTATDDGRITLDGEDTNDT